MPRTVSKDAADDPFKLLKDDYKADSQNINKTLKEKLQFRRNGEVISGWFRRKSWISCNGGVAAVIGWRYGTEINRAKSSDEEDDDDDY
jgi:glycosyltransferase A (GT-A) superfamily protein (DUF2064 family)